LLFFDNSIESLSKTEAKLIKMSRDVDQNIGYLKRRVLTKTMPALTKE
jgi:hypothetical protein